MGNLKVTREEWLSLALETLISHGVDAVNVLTLGQKLGVSRSSFYWYFESRQDLLGQLLEYWRSKNTHFILERAARPAPSITAAVLNVFECWADETLFNPHLDFAVRAWSRQSARVRKILDEADAQRTNAIRDMFRRYGYADEDAFVRARVLYFMQIGYYSLEIVEPMSSRLNLVPAYLRSFTGKEPRKGEVEAYVELINKRTARGRRARGSKGRARVKDAS